MLAVVATMADRSAQRDPAPQPANLVVFTQEDLHVRVMNPDGIAGLEFGQWCVAKSGGRIARLPWVKWAGPTTVVEYVIARTAGIGECPSGTHFEITKFDFGTMEGGKKAWEDNRQSVRSGLKVSFEAYISGQ